MESKIDVNTLTIGQAKKIAAMFQQCATPLYAREAATDLDDFAIGKTVIIRTYSAGVWCGTLDRKAGNEVILKDARRMWYWKCKDSISLSGVVKYGIEQKQSKIAPPVEYVWLEAIEIMPIEGDGSGDGYGDGDGYG